ncbi:MAG: enoyl-CoA hydratase [Actinophytocola sp.]|uniref:enoyl-CoA hydratase/isomerase family protein n=1 Tax=Actinophytocola sp. TaxID=1872138 RepID=UPI001325009F|nr:enoyl-CoA hydratase-related protein [Actinophytocola sp.]MPZ86153.1 enoyl-CoA hydratase [Actinophytocola sp.]
MTVTLKTDGPVATLTIDRPAKRNAMSFDMWSALPALLGKVDADDDLRALVIRGTDHFSAGADISEFTTLRADPGGARRYGAAVHAGERSIATLSKPTIAAVTGVCVGGGCEIALACDLRVAADDARFGITPAKLGIVYNATSTKRLVDAVGPAWARQILFTGEIIDAATALRIGLVNELHPAEGVGARATELATTTARRAQVSVRGAKTIIGRITDGHLDEDESVNALYEASVTSGDYAEGVRAFMEKRPPRF